MMRKQKQMKVTCLSCKLLQSYCLSLYDVSYFGFLHKMKFFTVLMVVYIYVSMLSLFCQIKIDKILLFTVIYSFFSKATNIFSLFFVSELIVQK